MKKEVRDGAVILPITKPILTCEGIYCFMPVFVHHTLVKPTNYVDPYGTLNHLHTIPFHLCNDS